MKPGKVAICISGLPRTAIQSHSIFRNFFQSLGEYDIFYHTWEEVTPAELNKIHSLYKPARYKVQPSIDRIANGSFGNMLYSIMMANELKKSYEIDNDFRYDLVIKTRFDLVFPQHNRFPINNWDPRTIYCPGGNNGINHTDFEHHGINDIIFWGDTQSMDIATNAYMYYKHVALEKNKGLLSGSKFDTTNIYYSAGNLIYDQCINRNIAITKYVTGIGEIPWRTDVSHLDPVKDYNQIRERYQYG